MIHTMNLSLITSLFVLMCGKCYALDAEETEYSDVDDTMAL